MRHHVKTRTLHRNRAQRGALLKSLARSLVLHGGIVTTLAKAKEVQPFVETLVTLSKAANLASIRMVNTRIGSKEAGKKLHEVYATRFAKRNGGYTRIIKLGRIGKRVLEAARIEFIEK